VRKDEFLTLCSLLLSQPKRHVDSPDWHCQKSGERLRNFFSILTVIHSPACMNRIPSHHSIELGVVPTHIRFVGGLVPDENGRLPRNAAGKNLAVAEMEQILSQSPVTVQAVQLTVFPGVHEGDFDEMMNGLKALGLKVYLILMVGGADPMDPADEDKVVAMLKSSITAAIKHGVTQVASTSVEEWMKPGAKPKTGSALAAAIAQDAKVHCRVVEESGLLNSCVKHWHIEFLRGGEFQTFTSVPKAWELVKAMNAKLGQKFFKLMVDAAHCGDSGLTIPENEAVIKELAAADEMGIFHASAKTTRGCLSTDDGWISALLRACADTGKLETVFVELFDHEDPALAGLREMDPRHGIDTRDGRTYTQAVIDGLVDVTRRLNNLQKRGILS
jgi:hypothetical protein